MQQTIQHQTVLRALFCAVFGRASRVLVLSSPQRASLIEMGLDGKKIGRTTTMFDGNVFRNLQKKQDSYERRLIFLARFIREKGIYELLHAFSELAPEYPNTQLVMAGDGPELEKAIQWATMHHLLDRVAFPGYLRGTEKAQALLDADIFVLPSRYGEGCPNGLLEAMGAGLGVIATPVGGIPELIAVPENGILLPDIEPETIREAIECFLSNPVYLHIVKQNNYYKAWQHFEAGIITREIEEVYKEIVTGAQRRSKAPHRT